MVAAPRLMLRMVQAMSQVLFIKFPPPMALALGRFALLRSSLGRCIGCLVRF